MQEIKLCRMENWMRHKDFTKVCSKNEPQVIVGAPCEELHLLQEAGYCVLAELTHLQGLTEEEIAEALCKEDAVLQYENVCICAEELSQAYLCRIWCKNKKLPVVIAETENLLIRESVEDDAKAFCELYSDEECRKYLELPPADDVKAYRQYIKDYQNGQYAFYEYGMWTLVEKNTSTVVGRAGLEQQTIAEDQIGLALGYAIHPKYRGKGDATEACQAILTYCKECEYTEKVYVKIHKKNTPSLAVYQKLGDTVELIMSE
jgi:RimJ/RimL family protein N-acetyltransferase